MLTRGAQESNGDKTTLLSFQFMVVVTVTMTNISSKFENDLQDTTEKLVNSSKFYDVTFRVGYGKENEEKGKIFRAIKCHLANISPVFEKQFFGNFKESKQDRDNPIPLPDCHPQSFECILRISLGLQPSIPQDIVPHCIVQSQYYQIPLLFTACLDQIHRNIDPTCALMVLNQVFIDNPKALDSTIDLKVFDQRKTVNFE